jgi:hypothetical protein
MNSRHNTKSSFIFEQRIGYIGMSEHNQVLHQARVAEAVVNAIVRLCEECARSRAESLMKSGAYYWL